MDVILMALNISSIKTSSHEHLVKKMENQSKTALAFVKRSSAMNVQ
jgi:hypothetical protein